MSSALSAEIFLPCLLDRLTDDDPRNPKERQYHLSVTMPQFRKNVLRDMGWLLNSPSPEGPEFSDYPQVLSSVINYGTPDLCGRTASSLDLAEVERWIAESITRFEPRILSDSLSVRAVPGINKACPNIIGFDISGFLWANPMPERFLLKTQLDLETGQCEFS